jgi:hypothetical protein
VAALLRLIVDELPAVDRARRAGELVGVFADARSTLELLANDSDDILRELAAHALPVLDKPRASDTANLLQLLERPA